MIKNESIRGTHAAAAVETTPAIDVATALAAGATEHMYMPAESLFGGVCNKVRAKGWTVLPQERQGKRLPSRIDGVNLKWGEFIERMPTAEETRRWGIQARAANAAILLGPSSGNVWAVDIDVLDEELSYAIQELAVEVLGATPFRRVGMAPKIALFYRAETEDELPTYKNFRFVDADGTSGSEHGIEILGRGRLITCYGYHHKTSEYFRWYAHQPLSATPSDVPVVTPAQLEEFVAAVQDVRAFYRPAPKAVQWIEGEGGDVVAGKLDMRSATAEWVQNEAGLVTDGRDNFLWALTRSTVRKHGADILIGAVGEKDMLTAIRDAFRVAECQDKKRWSDRDLQQAVADKVGRAVAMLRDGRMKPALMRTVQTAEGPVKKAAKPYRRPTIRQQDHDAFEFLGTNRASLPTTSWPIDPAAAEARRLRKDREAMGAEATAALEAGITAFFDDILRCAETEPPMKEGETREPRKVPVHILDGATGLGKSTKTIQIAATHPAVRAPLKAPDGSDPGPLLFMLPQYRNVQELKSRADLLGLDDTASDDELVAAADAMGMVSEAVADDYTKELSKTAKDAGLKTMIYGGKVWAGCQRAVEMKALSDAGVPSSGLCSKRVPVKDSQGQVTDHQDTYCEFYATCPAIAQRHLIKEHHVVFLVRSFLTLSVPEQLSSARGLVMDEKFFDLLVHTGTMPLSTLDIARREPRLTKREREEGMVPVDLLQSRTEAVEIAKKALRAGSDLGKTFYAFKREFVDKDGRTVLVRGTELVADARRVCANAMTSLADIDPGMTAAEIIEMCGRPTGTNVALEYRFWKLIEDRMCDIAADELAGREGTPDRRIALLNPKSKDAAIRVAWKTEANWASVPKLLLDASTDSVLTKLVLGENVEIIRHRVEVTLNMRLLAAVDRRLTMSKLFPPKDAAPERQSAAAELLSGIRMIISTVCMTHAHARVFIALPMKLRRAVLKCWAAPFNADFGHHGAVAGIDAYRQHGACLAISRMEIAVQDIDGIVAALTYGTAHYEDAIDPDGTGEDKSGETIYPSLRDRFWKMRDGSQQSMEVQEHAGDIARRVQAQAREEELRQIFGRIRPVWREKTIPVFAVTESIPDDMIIDEICAFQDLSRRAGGRFWDAVRLTGGVIQPEILAMVAPHHGDAAQYRRWIKQFVDDVPSVRARYSEVDIIREGGDIFPAYVAGLRVEGRYLIVPYLKAMGWKGNLAVSKRCQCVMKPVGEAPRDKVSEALGDEVSAEWEAQLALYAVLKDRGIWQPGDKVPDMVKAGSTADDIMSGAVMSVGAWLALPNLRDKWVLHGEKLPPEDKSEAEMCEMVEAIGF